MISAHMFTSMPAILLPAKNSRHVTDRYKRRKGADRNQTPINVFIENKVIAIHLASTGNPVPRIGTNIRYREIFFLLQVILPVGSGICKLCRISHHQTLASRGNRCTNERESGVQMTTNDTAQKSSPLQPTTNQEEPELKSHTENQCNAANFLTVAVSTFPLTIIGVYAKLSR
uniref:Uncharacterized protein n=1 Tax=Magallana gigas TaxID=29159 RepID=A0A8W8MID2_MAGGI